MFFSLLDLWFEMKCEYSFTIAYAHLIEEFAALLLSK